MAAINLSDLRLSQPLPIQLGQIGNYVTITDPSFPALSTTVVDGYDSQGNALSSVQVFRRTAKIVCDIDNISDGPVTINTTTGQNLQLAQVTSLCPLLNDDSTFPALSTTVVDGYTSFGTANSSVQVFPRTVQFVKFASGVSYNVNTPLPIQLGQVVNFFPITNGIAALSTTVVDGYDSMGSANQSIQVNNRNAALVQEVGTLNWQQTYAAPIQLSQVTNYVAINNNDSTYAALSTTVVNGYSSTGSGAISSTQVFPRTSALVYEINGVAIDTNVPLPINLAQDLSYVPLNNDDSTYPALSTTVVNGYDSLGNAISSVQVFPRMVQLVYVINT